MVIYANIMDLESTLLFYSTFPKVFFLFLGAFVSSTAAVFFPGGCFFFVPSYSHLAYLDYGGALFCLPSRPEGRARWQHPRPPSADIKSALESHQENYKGKRSRTGIKEITNETRYQKPVCHYSACSSTSSSASSASASSTSSSLSQFSSTGGAVFPTWVLRKKSRAAGLHLSSASRSPMRHFCFPFFVVSLTLAHNAACWSFHL